LTRQEIAEKRRKSEVTYILFWQYGQEGRKGGSLNMNGTQRINIRPGLKVRVVQKQHQRTGQLTEGIVKDILTNSATHPHGIKVRLESGVVGRVQEIVGG
jgi:uncharacterized repeat protein (TIGR03833 family)